MSDNTRALLMAQELSGQWVIPILFHIEACGGRFTPLQHRLNVAPARLSDNLKRLTQRNLIKHLSPLERRHPLLPEYVVTEHGQAYRQAAKAIREAEALLEQGRLSAKAWNVPVLLALCFGHERFQELRFALRNITPRMLSTRLEELQAAGLVDKRLETAPRPAYVYELHHSAKPVLDQLAGELSALVSWSD